MLFTLAIILFIASLVALSSQNTGAQRVALLVFIAAIIVLWINPSANAASQRDTCHVHNQYALCGASTCATINNVTNRAAWIDSRGRTHRASYREDGSLHFNRKVPRSVLIAAAKLTAGAAGPKIARACL